MRRVVESPLYLPVIFILAALSEGIIEALAKVLGF